MKRFISRQGYHVISIWTKQGEYYWMRDGHVYSTALAPAVKDMVIAIYNGFNKSVWIEANLKKYYENCS